MDEMKIERRDLNARIFIHIDMPDKRWHKKLYECEGAVVKVTGTALPNRLEHMRAAMQDVATFAQEQGAVHVVMTVPKAARVEKALRHLHVLSIPLREAVVKYIECNPHPDIEADDIRGEAETIMQEEGV